MSTSTPIRLAAFGLALGLVLGGGAVVGNAVGPVTSGTEGTDDMDDMDGHGPDAGTPVADPAAVSTEEVDMPAGLLIAQDGYTLEADTTALDAGAAGPFRFRVLGPDGRAVERFEVSHEKELHLIVVGTDLATYHHLHPTRGDGGTWTVDLPALAPGVYRAYADFAVADGPELTLGVDLTVAGETRFAPLPEPVATAEVDGYEVTLAGSPVAGASADLTLTVRRGGRPVTDVEPYLGAFGHLVAIRSGDLAYLHVHPHGDEVTDPGARGGPDVRFAVAIPSAGAYRLYFDFRHGGEVHTAAFTVEVPAAGAGAGVDAGATPAHDDGGHG